MVKNLQSDFYSLKCGLASFLATYVAGVLHPLDVLKTRFQSHDGMDAKQNLIPKYNGIRKAFKQIYQSEGIRGLYKGFYMSIFSQALAASFFFWIYERRKLYYQNNNYSSMICVLLASGQASIIGTLVTQPLWVLKTKLILNTNSQISELALIKNKVATIIAQQGFIGFSKGLTLSLILSVSGVLQMFFYEGSKKIYTYLKIPESGLNQKNFIAGSLSKILATILTYPITTLRTRVQQDQIFNDRKVPKYLGTLDAFNKLWRMEGVKGFYKGIVPNMMRGIPYKGIYFYSYQFFKGLMIKQNI